MRAVLQRLRYILGNKDIIQLSKKEGNINLYNFSSITNILVSNGKKIEIMHKISFILLQQLIA